MDTNTNNNLINKRKNINLRRRRRIRRSRNMRRKQNILIRRISRRRRRSLLRITNRRSLLMERCHTCTISLCCIFVFSMLSQRAPPSCHIALALLMAGSCIIRVPNMYTISGGVRHVISWSELFRLEFLDFFIPMRPH